MSVYKDLVKIGRCGNSSHEVAVKEILDGLKHEHRTVQAGFIRMLKEILIGYSEFPSDARNEEAVAFCKQIKDMNPYIPYI